MIDTPPELRSNLINLILSLGHYIYFLDLACINRDMSASAVVDLRNSFGVVFIGLVVSTTLVLSFALNS